MGEKVNNMATLNGQTPQAIAKEIVNDAVTPQLIEIDGITSQNLDKLARKSHLAEIDALGERHWNKNRERYRNEFVVNFVRGAYKQLVKQLEKREREMAQTYYDSLIKSGMQPNEAHKLAFASNGVEVKPETK
jgi:hypothetical protein